MAADVQDCACGLPPRSAGADIAAPGAVLRMAFQQPAEPRVRQLARALPRLLPAAVDDADLRGLLAMGLGPPPRDRLRVVLRGAGVPGRPELIRLRAAGAGGARPADVEAERARRAGRLRPRH